MPAQQRVRRGRSNTLGYRREPTIELDEEKASTALRPDAAVRLAPHQMKLLSQHSILGFKAALDLKNVANSSWQEDQGNRCRQRGPIRSPVHADKVLGTHGNGERLSSSLRTGRVSLRVRGAPAGEALLIEQSRSDFVALAPGALNHQDELLIARRGAACRVKFQCPSRKDPFEARMCISSQHTASAATALSLDVIRSIAQLLDRARRVDLRANSAPRASFLHRARLRVLGQMSHMKRRLK
jgi:hypothetical protein